MYKMPSGGTSERWIVGLVILFFFCIGLLAGLSLNHVVYEVHTCPYILEGREH